MQLYFTRSVIPLIIPRGLHENAWMNIADKLDRAMRAAGYRTQSQLAKNSGVPQATISRILKGGGSQGPETNTLTRLAEACGLTLAQLTGLESHREQDSGIRATMGVPVSANYAPTKAALIKLIRTLDKDQLQVAWDVLGYFMSIKRTAGEDAIVVHSNLVSGDPPIRERDNAASRKSKRFPSGS